MATVDDLSGLQRTAYDLMEEVINGGSVENAKNLIVEADIAHVAIVIADALKPVAVGLLIVYFLLDITEKSTTLTRGNLDEKFLIEALLKLILAVSALTFAPNIIAWGFRASNSFVDAMDSLDLMASGPAGDTSGLKAELIDYLSGINMISAFGLIIIVMLVYAVSKVAYMALEFQTIAKKFEIVLMMTLAIIALPGMFSENKQSAINYVKKMFACALHTGMIVIIVKLANYMSLANMVTSLDGGFSFGAITSLVKPALYIFAAIGSISVAKSAVNSALGV